ncbi:flagellar biosynthesis protein FlgN [Thermoanaerobacterium sp. PSU-2]|uniref:flagellar protein FlgN n=1 Tax=Thermoanaerobacterium sp. PSU-2 TaxID=1930849 RepID=UPI000A1527DC|nr:flagellar protein FlgN [Thermoanaerobacterium sp. PSU-2]ORX24538.1 flagellar biosynthesis protein FlgN [Thermoanaerobacterium sp. PSU-2]HHV74871.1 flagellar protein FlgN [Thermoanaerobacterium sp.]
MPNPNIDELISILNGEMLLYKDLYDIAAKKTDVIVRGEIHELDNMTKVEGSIIGKLMDLEDEREKFLNDNFDSQMTISQLCGILPEDDAEKLKTVQEEFNDLLRALSNRNELNKSLLKQSIEFVNYSIGVISNNLLEDNGIYGEGGVSKKINRIIDKKA